MTTGIELPFEARETYWLSRDVRSDLAETITDYLTLASPLPFVRDSLDAVLMELGVTEARDLMWPEPNRVARTARGLPQDVVPVRFSIVEEQALLNLPLSSTVRTALAR